MKEILYIQAGTLSNYAGTHFWNTQESYFTYDENDEPLTFHDISFREGIDEKGHPTFCPRLLAFDRKANFGAISALIPTDEIPVAGYPPLWSGNRVEYKQQLIAKSQYQTSIDESGDIHDSGDIEARGDEVRYWSDFNRVYYTARTVQQVPDPADRENVDGDWTFGQESFMRYDEDTGLMEGPVRLFLEECDSLQGIQVMNDTASFGSFTNSLLTRLHDEYLKLPSLNFPLLSDVTPKHIDLNNKRGVMKVLNDAMYLVSLNELSSMSIPIQSASTWSSDMYNPYLNFDRNSMYHTSAILSAHIENSTLPLRLKGARDDITSFAAQLNWRGITSFGQLSGMFPLVSSADLDDHVFELSVSRSDKDASLFARRDVSRGFSQQRILDYNKWSERLSLNNAFVASVHAPAYPLPSSFPSLFELTDTTSLPRSGNLTPNRSIPLFSHITTTSQTAHLFSEYATFIEDCLKHKSGLDVSLGLDVDEMKNTVNDLWTLHDNYWL